MFNNFFSENCAFMRYVEKYGTATHVTDDNIMWRMRFACCITKATDTRTTQVTLIALPRQQWSSECASIFLYTYIAPTVNLQ
jgi:hypothetical protein